MTTHTLNLQDVSVRYGNTLAIERASLQAPDGAITALVGPSGCGKSSLLKAINRIATLDPACRIEGRIHLGDQDLTAANINLRWLRQTVGMVFQHPNPFPLSIEDNIQFPLREHGTKRKRRLRDKTAAALQKVGLWEEVKNRLKQPALTLSGGQQQRLCMARCLALEPKVLLLDEPCSALDPMATTAVEQLIQSLRGEVTVLLVTHNLAQARRLADNVAVCWVQSGCGCIIESGPAQSVLETPAHPITRAFCRGEQG